jgi:FkbM family methyltransferase
MSSVKARLRQVLESVVNRHRFNDSVVYKLYLALCFPSYVVLKRLEVRFYKEILAETDRKLIFDIGANEGSKAIIFSCLADQIIIVEPSPAAAQILKQRFKRKPNVIVVESGVGDQAGVAKFYMFNDADAYNTFSLKWKDSLSATATEIRPRKEVTKTMDVSIVTLDDLIKRYGVPSYIKIDVEGSELNVINGLSTSVQRVSFECNLPEFEAEAIACISRLARLQPGAQFNYCLTEPPTQFASTTWLSARDMERVVESDKLSFMEIYCKSNETNSH